MDTKTMLETNVMNALVELYFPQRRPGSADFSDSQGDIFPAEEYLQSRLLRQFDMECPEDFRNDGKIKERKDINIGDVFNYQGAFADYEQYNLGTRIIRKWGDSIQKEGTYLEQLSKHKALITHYSNPENLADFLGADLDESLTLVGTEKTFKELFGIDRCLAPDLIFKVEKNGKITYYIGEVKINEKLRKSALSRVTSYHMVLNNNKIENVPFVIAGSIKQFLKRMN